MNNGKTMCKINQRYDNKAGVVITIPFEEMTAYYLPENCDRCPVVWRCDSCNVLIETKEESYKNGRPKDCPIKKL